MTVNFPTKISVPVNNHLSGKSYALMRMDEVKSVEDVKTQLIESANEPKIYQWRFKEMCEDKPYTRTRADEFFDYGLTGWNENKAFVFLLFSDAGELAAAIDIKSSELDGAEVGYWAGEDHRGCMTNTCRALVALARDAGFKRLFARVKSSNQESSGVLERSGFEYNVMKSEEDHAYDFYEIELETKPV